MYTSVSTVANKTQGSTSRHTHPHTPVSADRLVTSATDHYRYVCHGLGCCREIL